MSIAQLTELTCYPIKGMQGFKQHVVKVLNRQLAYTDTLHLLQIDGTPLTEAILLRLKQLSCQQNSQRSILSNQDGSSISFEHRVFDLHNMAPLEINRWLSQQLSCDVQLFNQDPIIRADNLSNSPSRFPQYYQLLNLANPPLIQRNSVLTASHFTFANATAWIEHTWDYLKIGEVIFKVLASQDNKLNSAAPCFIYPINDGVIQLGDSIIPLLSSAPSRLKASKQQNITNITLKLNQIVLVGNTQQTLLEQFERNGLNLPYSCRAGICKQCRLTLIKGEVTALNRQALQPNNEILSCSCIPLSDLELSIEQDISD